jgi:oligopeptide transport system substrate-binding protein
MINWKQWRYMLLALFAIIALAAFSACGDDDDDDGGDDATDEPTASGAAPTETDDGGSGGDGRAQGGDMVVQGNEFDSLDPHFSSFAQDISLHRMLWRGLYSLDIDNNVIPSMAASDPEISADGLTVTVALKEGLTWSDGDDLLAEDYVAGIQRTCNPTNAGQYQYVLTALAGCNDYYGALGSEDAPLSPTQEELDALRDAVGVTAVDDTTIEFTLTDPQPTFPIILALWMTFPVPTHLNILPDAAWPTDPGGLAYNGPYMLDSYTPQDSVVLLPNPNWAAPNGVSPTLDSLTIRFIDDTAVANDAFRTDELSFSQADTSVLPAVVSEFGEGEEYFKSIKPSTRGLQMNLERPPLDNLDVRLALSQALDRQTIIDVAVNGAHEPTTSWLPEVVPGGPGPDEFDECCGFNPESAQAHLAAAGYEGGAGFPELNILIGDTPAARATAQIIQQSLQDNLSITVGIDVVDAATRSARFTAEDFDLFLGGWIQDYPDPENWIVGLFDTDGPLNHYNCSNAEIDSLIEENLYNQDNDARVQAYTDINELIVTTVCGIAPYWHENDHYLIKSDVVGMEENIAGQDAFQAGDWAAESWGFAE